MKFNIVVITLYMFINTPGNTFQRSSKERLASATLDFPQLAQKYGFNVEEHNVTTEDGYILKMFHIPGDKNKPVLIMHGFLDSADSLILRGQKSLPAVLVEAGYDVWLGNTRGNKYSRRHQRLDPDTDKKFWDFSFHEMAVYDLPVFIDFILQENAVGSLRLIGHSLGNTLFYVLGSVKPEYNDVIDIAIALGPGCYFNYDNYENPINLLFIIGPLVNQWLIETNQEEIFGDNFILTKLIRRVCENKWMGYSICAAIFADIGGEDLEEFEPEFFYSLISHFPTSSSRKCGFHLVQLGLRKEFAHYDYGPENNYEMYGSQVSPLYDLDKVTMKVALVVGKNDKLIPLDNVAILRDKLPNVVDYHVMQRAKFNHIDHVWGRNMNKYLLPHIIKILNTYS